MKTTVKHSYRIEVLLLLLLFLSNTGLVNAEIVIIPKDPEYLSIERTEQYSECFPITKIVFTKKAMQVLYSDRAILDCKKYKKVLANDNSVLFYKVKLTETINKINFFNMPELMGKQTFGDFRIYRITFKENDITTTKLIRFKNYNETIRSSKNQKVKNMVLLDSVINSIVMKYLGNVR